jgi:hypothetical protein
VNGSTTSRIAVAFLTLCLMASASCGRGATEVELLVTVHIGAEEADCVALIPRRGLQFRESQRRPWLPFPDEIEGFAWELGYAYTLVVIRRTTPEPAAGRLVIRATNGPCPRAGAGLTADAARPRPPLRQRASCTPPRTDDTPPRTAS